MKYYIVTSEVFESLDQDKIEFASVSNNGDEWVVSTTEVVEDVIDSFRSGEELSSHTFENGSFWTGDDTGIEEWELNEIEYRNEI
tara:strand:+ start:877 stop:1131 length:255 start_codon:yes stop_codon:yes gene_type:complete